MDNAAIDGRAKALLEALSSLTPALATTAKEIGTAAGTVETGEAGGTATNNLASATESIATEFRALSVTNTTVASSALSAVTSLPASIAASVTSSSGSGVTKALTTVLTSGLGIGSLISGLFSLFGGGSSSSSTSSLVRYAAPDSISVEQASVGSGVADAVYDQTGMPRVVSGEQSGESSTTTGSSTESSVSQSASSTAAGATINLTVQALDSQSIMDRSSDIARAVREAMLTMNSINDVVNEL
jgi:hypothetical protein